MSILVTGFEPTDKGLNASELLIESLRADPPAGLSAVADRLHYEVISTDSHALERELTGAIERHRPRLCVLTGQARGRNKVNLERIATNLLDFRVPDGAGNLIKGRRIVEDGPTAYWSTLPVERIAETLLEAGIPAVASNHAGNFLCNQILYHALHYAARQDPSMLAGFVHIPPLPEQTRSQWPESPFMPLEMTRRAMEITLLTLSRHPETA